MRLPPSKPSLVILTLAALLAVPHQVEYLQDYQLMDWRRIPAVVDFQPRVNPAAAAAEEEPRVSTERAAAGAPVFRITGAEGALDAFYEALHQTELRQPGAVARVLHYGDSPTTADLITGDVRRLLQRQFGDAGHGFCLLAKPWAWYDHAGVTLRAAGWEIEAATMNRTRDGFYGLGGVSFRGDAGAWARWTFRDPGHTSLELSYLAQPGGGAVRIVADGQIVGKVETASAAVSPGFTEMRTPRPAREFEAHAEGPVRLFGAVFRKQDAGVMYDSIGLNGASVYILARIFHERHWAAQLAHARPDLVVINYGTNESGYLSYIDQYYTKELKEIIRRVRAATPQASLLIMSPMDRGRREPGGAIGTLPGIPKLTAIQRQVALETGCAFFDTYQAMGGPGTMGRWYEAEPRLVAGDFIHPLPAGARIVGKLMYQALLEGFNRYKVRKMQERFTQAGVRPAERTVRR